MPIVVKGRLARRVERRLGDYLVTLEDGTAQSVGRSEPRLPDKRGELEVTPSGPGEAHLQAIEALLDEVWKSDERNWQRRVRPFLKRLDIDASGRFESLVKAGCQPDRLAKYFNDATSPTAAVKDTKRLRRDIGNLLRLAQVALGAVRKFHGRRGDFDKYTAFQRLRVLYGEPGPAALNALCWDFEDFVKTDSDELKHYLKQLDGRRQLLLADPLMKLSACIHDITGRRHDADVETIFDSLLENQGRLGQHRGTLKRRRLRWTKRFGGRTKGNIKEE